MQRHHRHPLGSSSAEAVANDLRYTMSAELYKLVFCLGHRYFDSVSPSPAQELRLLRFFAACYVVDTLRLAFKEVDAYITRLATVEFPAYLAYLKTMQDAAIAKGIACPSPLELLVVCISKEPTMPCDQLHFPRTWSACSASLEGQVVFFSKLYSSLANGVDAVTPVEDMRQYHERLLREYESTSSPHIFTGCKLLGRLNQVIVEKQQGLRTTDSFWRNTMHADACEFIVAFFARRAHLPSSRFNAQKPEDFTGLYHQILHFIQLGRELKFGVTPIRVNELQGRLVEFCRDYYSKASYIENSRATNNAELARLWYLSYGARDLDTLIFTRIQQANVALRNVIHASTTMEDVFVTMIHQLVKSIALLEPEMLPSSLPLEYAPPFVLYDSEEIKYCLAQLQIVITPEESAEQALQKVWHHYNETGKRYKAAVTVEERQTAVMAVNQVSQHIDMLLEHFYALSMQARQKQPAPTAGMGLFDRQPVGEPVATQTPDQSPLRKP